LKENFGRFKLVLHKEKEMADFRRCIPVIALVAVLLGVAGTASAQPFSCIPSAVTPLLRAEGLTELVGDLVLTCTGGTPTPAPAPGIPGVIPPVNIQLFLNTSVTSRLLANPWSEALLLLDDPAPAPGVPGHFSCETTSGVCVGIGNGTGSGYYGAGPSGTPGNNKNVFQGQQAGANSILWLGVPIDPPGTAPGATRIIRITNIRANANALGVAGGTSTPTPIIAVLSNSGSTSVPASTVTQTVGLVVKGLDFAVRTANAGASALSSPFGFLQCISAGPPPFRFAVLRYSELFATAFKRRNLATPAITTVAGGPGYGPLPPVGTAAQRQADASPTPVNQDTPGTIYNTETGLYNPTFIGNPARGTLANAGLADFGTRLKAVFNNIPAGVSLWVDVYGTEVNGVPDAARLTSSEAGGFSAVAAASPGPTAWGGSAQLAISGGSATAVWEILNSDSTSLAQIDFGVYIRFTANPGANSPGLGTGTVNGSFAPISTATTATTGPIPRFADTSTAINLYTISTCATNLLFPFVTDQAGFETGIAISNTSQDPFGTSTQTGTCTLNFYGAGAPAAVTTAAVAAGTTYTTLLTSVAPNFSGYIIVRCNFQYAHGFSFLTHPAAHAMGYLALVIPDPPRAAIHGANNFLFGGEQLGQ